MEKRTAWVLTVALILLPVTFSRAQEITSRVIPFNLPTSLPPGTTQEVVVELWAAGSEGKEVFSESYTGPDSLAVDEGGSISFRLGSLQQPPGLNPEQFPSGSSRYLDVTQGGQSVLSARFPLTAVAFALSPGPQGPPGPSDVPANLTMVSSTATAGNLLKGGVLFLHNFANNTFLGSDAGNLTMTGQSNTGVGGLALTSNSIGRGNTANGFRALMSNTTGFTNTATGFDALSNNTGGDDNTASGAEALFTNSTGTGNTANGRRALYANTRGFGNTAIGDFAMWHSITGNTNTAVGNMALSGNIFGVDNTAIGAGADTAGDFQNATAIGARAIVNDSNKVRLGSHDVTVIEGEVGFTASSDRTKKENLKALQGEEVLGKIRDLTVTSWNFIGHDPKKFRHYGPMAQDFFAAFGQDGIGTIGTDTTITSTDMDGILMAAAQALEKRSGEQKKEIEALRDETAGLRARLEAVERIIGSKAASQSTQK